MPKGSVPRGRDYFGAVVSPSAKRKQTQAKFKNTMRENFPTAAQYREDVKAAAARKDVRSDASLKRARKTVKAPVGKGGK